MELRVEKRKFGQSGPLRVALGIPLDDLIEILENESAIINPDDVSRLLGAIHTYAATAENSKQDALDAWEAVVERMEEEEGDDGEPEKDDADEAE